MKKLIILWSLMYISGCATQQIYSKQYVPTLNNGKGNVFLSVIETKKSRAFPVIHIRNTATGEEAAANSFPLQWDAPITRMTNQKTTDFDNETGTLILLKLQAGKYEAFKWSIFRGTAQFGVTTEYKIQNPVSFEVVADQTTYVGSFLLDSEGMHFSSDKYSRDEQSLRSKFINFSPD
ncbi:hypothetical protein [Psychrobium sp. 1_MG-2023]|uniref:hypothetical protein n=1 Tax=Psychrobium sp. 1_MG-2023 TaxID=3062624 RepID=UPI000C32D593|nr:hypothetical protein [Psychrobium sp. 1_MG-2023]MDP2559734.1 hypothetical protein [Psychrobium sp. 1_MG-2023]PKF59157.1 hypothetical protein CW748_02920 [Alteromonadales bacterium alter-6D02]